MLHDAVVDADVRQGGVDLGEAGGLGAAAGRVVEVAQAGGELGQVLFDGAHHLAGAEDEHAAVPQVAAALDEGAGTLERRLLDEALDTVRVSAEGRARLDVAEAGVGPRRREPDGGEEACVGLGERLAQGAEEGGFVSDDVVGREDHHEGVGVAARDDVGRPADARRGVAADGLAEHVLGRQIGQGALGGRAQPLARGDVEARRGAERGDAAARGGDERLGRVGAEGEKLLGQLVARGGPEAGAGAAGEHDGVGGVGRHGRGARRPGAGEGVERFRRRRRRAWGRPWARRGAGRGRRRRRRRSAGRPTR